MKPFDLEAAKAGAPVMTRTGGEARVGLYDVKGPYPLLGVVESSYGSELAQSWTKHGLINRDGREHEFDLVMAPVKVTKWANVYKTCSEKRM